MKFPPLRKPRENLKSGYTELYVKQYMMKCVHLALQENSVDWQSLTDDEILRLVPKNEDPYKFLKFAKEIEVVLERINTWHL